jgi:hypothetical protein
VARFCQLEAGQNLAIPKQPCHAFIMPLGGAAAPPGGRVVLHAIVHRP